MTTNNRIKLGLSLVLSCFAACAPVDDSDTAQSSDAVLSLNATVGSTALSPNLPTPIALGAPTITGLTPSSGRVGDHVVIRGSSLDRARAGRYVLAGNLGYAVTFAGTNGTRVSASTLTLRSATELDVVVPTQAATGSVQLIDGLGTLSTSPVNFTVTVPPPPPSPTLLRIVNNSQYDLGSVAINGTSTVSCASPIAPGTSRDFTVMPGLVTTAAVMGWCINGRAESIAPQALVGQVSLVNGSTGTLTVNPVTLGDVLTNFGSSVAQFSTGLYVENGGFHEHSLYFDGAARWSALLDGSQWASGTASVVSWPARATCITMRLTATSQNISFCLPFTRIEFSGRTHIRV